MRIKLATPLIGEFPRYANVKLPDNAGVTAQNMRLDSGVLKPLNGYTTGATLALTGHNINSIHLWIGRRRCVNGQSVTTHTYLFHKKQLLVVTG